MILLFKYLYDTLYVVEEGLLCVRKVYIPFSYPVKNVSASMKYEVLRRVLEVSLRIAAR
jgi:hypothetical protein